MAVNIDPDVDETDEPDLPTEDSTFLRARQFCADNRLLRVEYETPSGKLVAYTDPALYLEAFALLEVQRAMRETYKATTEKIHEAIREAAMSEGDRGTGTIKRLVKDRGFGFIRTDDGQQELFFHRSQLTDSTIFFSLQEGDHVKFTETMDQKGLRAVDVGLA